MNVQIGNNINICNGRIVLGNKKEIWQFFSVQIYLCFIISIWCLFVMGIFIEKKIEYVLWLVFLVYGYAVFFHLRCFATEPGIIPRNNEKEEMESIFEEDKSIDRPKIYTERFCSTCNMIRRPKVSHCHLCDNCVQNFDHHCSFIANCVGERNHRSFLFFLFFYTFLLLLIILTCVYHITKIIFEHEILNLAIDQYSYYFCTGLGLMIMGILLYFYSRMLSYVFSLTGMFCLFFLFNHIIGSEKDLRMIPYINTVSILLIYACIPSLSFSAGMLFNQTSLISKGLTTKQFESIKIYRRSISELSEPISDLGEAYTKTIDSLTFRQRIKNISIFICRPKPPSLI